MRGTDMLYNIVMTSLLVFSVILVIYLAGVCITQQERIDDIEDEKDLLKDQLHWIRLDDLTKATLKSDFDKECE
jgi:hypothetical protein